MLDADIKVNIGMIVKLLTKLLSHEASFEKDTMIKMRSY